MDEGLTAREWAASLATPNLLIAPDSDTGVMPLELDAVEEFVRRHDTQPEAVDTGTA